MLSIPPCEAQLKNRLLTSSLFLSCSSKKSPRLPADHPVPSFQMNKMVLGALPERMQRVETLVADDTCDMASYYFL